MSPTLIESELFGHERGSFTLNVFVLPPLREREDDLELLAEDALDQLNQQNGTSKRFTKGCLERLKRHSWPGLSE
jgi:transcriptional regulator with GAF, ATPase, and Fis domain